MNRTPRWDVPVMVTLLAIVVLGSWWGLADGVTSDDGDAPPTPHFISAPPPVRHRAPASVEYELQQQPDVDATRVAVLGTSAGCALSAWYALGSHEPSAAVLVAFPNFSRISSAQTSPRSCS